MRVITLKRPQNMQPYLAEVWTLLRSSYAQVEGGWHYASPQALLDESACWRLVLLGGKVVTAVVYKAKKGLKLVAMGIDQSMAEWGKRGLQKVISADLRLRRCWMELSEAAERFVLKHCGGHRHIIHHSLVPALLGKDVEPTNDGYHYRRIVCGIEKCKIALGTAS